MRSKKQKEHIEIFMRIKLLLIFVVSFQLIFAQTESLDSVVEIQPIDSVAVIDESTQFKPTQLILPLSLVAIGSTGLYVDWCKDAKHYVRNEVCEWRGDNYCKVDDYLQYLPVAAYLGLDYIGVKAKHSFVERMCAGATSYLTMAILVNTTKYLVNSPRPDSDATNSFPSGHTATVFTGAELVRKEYGWGAGIGAYVVACGVGFMRVWNDRHWFTDVLAGAGVGILSANIGYWMLPVWQDLFNLKKSNAAIAITPYYNHFNKEFGAGMAMVF